MALSGDNLSRVGVDQGLTTVHEHLPGGEVPIIVPLKWHTFFTDFNEYVAGDWTVTETNAGATQALADSAGGVLLITNTAADNDLVALQYKGESFKFVSGKKLYFECRFKVSDATQSDLIFGLQITDTTPLDVSDGVFFMKDDGDANLDFHVEKNNTATSVTALTTLANDTYIKLHFMYDGDSKVRYGYNGNWVASSVTTNLVDDEELCVSLALQNGEAVAKTMSIDYILVVQELSR